MREAVKDVVACGQNSPLCPEEKKCKHGNRGGHATAVACEQDQMRSQKGLECHQRSQVYQRVPKILPTHEVVECCDIMACPGNAESFCGN